MDGTFTGSPKRRQQSTAAKISDKKTQSIYKNLLPDFEPVPYYPLSEPLLPESFLLAMRTLQIELEQERKDHRELRTSNELLQEEVAQLRQKLLDGYRYKLEGEVRLNEILRDRAGINEQLNQSKLYGMVLKKYIEQLKKYKQNVLYKVTEQVCKQRAISILEYQIDERHRKENINYENSLKQRKHNQFHTPYLKEAVSTELPMKEIPISYLPLITLNPNHTLSEMPSFEKSTPVSIIRHNASAPSYEPLESNSYSYLKPLKDLMRDEKLLVYLTFQLERYQLQLLQYDRKADKTKGKYQLLLKIDVLRRDIAMLKKDIGEARRRQSLF